MFPFLYFIFDLKHLIRTFLQNGEDRVTSIVAAKREIMGFIYIYYLHPYWCHRLITIKNKKYFSFE